MTRTDAIAKLPTGIPGFDLISAGGLPLGRTTLVSGTAGSAKTIFSAQFLASGIRSSGEPAVFVTFEETPQDIRDNMRSLGWDIAKWEADELWAFVDASPEPTESVVAGEFDLGALLARIEAAITRIGAKRVSIDSLGAVFSRFDSTSIIRGELLRLALTLKRLHVTSVLTAERDEEHGAISRFGVEEFVSDNVIILRNTLEEEKRRRTIEVLKFRGTRHQKGEFPFTVTPGAGIAVIPLSAIELTQASTDLRITSGNADLDDMCDGGFFRDSIVLVTGATGCGKTLMTTEFIAGGAAAGERCLLLAFEESRDQLIRNARGWGVDYPQMEADGQLKIVSTYPESAALEDHLIDIESQVEAFRPQRLAVDSLSALERVAPLKGYREFVLALTSFIKHREICGMFTATTPTLTGGASVTETHISTITDTIILLRYVEMFGEMRRALTVLKMRGSMHDKRIREYAIDGAGMQIGAAFRFMTGIVSGSPQHVSPGELDKMDGMFRGQH